MATRRRSGEWWQRAFPQLLDESEWAATRRKSLDAGTNGASSSRDRLLQRLTRRPARGDAARRSSSELGNRLDPLFAVDADYFGRSVSMGPWSEHSTGSEDLQRANSCADGSAWTRTMSLGAQPRSMTPQAMRRPSLPGSLDNESGGTDTPPVVPEDEEAVDNDALGRLGSAGRLKPARRSSSFGLPATSGEFKRAASLAAPRRHQSFSGPSGLGKIEEKCPDSAKPGEGSSRGFGRRASVATTAEEAAAVAAQSAMRKLALRRRSSSGSTLGTPDGREPAGVSFGWASNAGGDKPLVTMISRVDKSELARQQGKVLRERISRHNQPLQERRRSKEEQSERERREHLRMLRSTEKLLSGKVKMVPSEKLVEFISMQIFSRLGETQPDAAALFNSDVNMGILREWRGGLPGPPDLAFVVQACAPARALRPAWRLTLLTSAAFLCR
jgi:hypothetical protein